MFTRMTPHRPHRSPATPGASARASVLAAIAAISLVGLSVQGASIASADEAPDAAATGVTVPADPTQAVEAPSDPSPADQGAHEIADAGDGAGAAGAAEPADATEPAGTTDPASPADPSGTGDDPADALVAPSEPAPADAAPADAAPADAAPADAAPADATPADAAPADAAPAAAGPSALKAAELVNTAPIAVDDYYTVAKNTEFTVAAPGALSNDIDAEGDQLFINQGYHQTVAGGHIYFKWDRSFTYTPAPGFSGVDTTTYFVSDGVLNSEMSATIHFTVVDTTDQAPTANDDSYSTPAGMALSVGASGVLGNDTDPDGDALYLPDALTGGAAQPTTGGGTVAWQSSGGFVYQPAVGFIGYDTITYWATDLVLDSHLATVTIKVGDWVNQPPVAADDGYSTAVNRPLVVDAQHGLLANDSDAEDALSVIVPSLLPTDHGRVYLNTDGSFRYEASYSNYLGLDSFTYQVTDGSYNLPVTATVTIDLTAMQNDAPVAADDHYSTAKDTALSVEAPQGVLTNDVDPDGDALYSVGFADPATAAGGLVLLNEDGSFSYTPPVGFVGEDTFGYTAMDTYLGSTTAIAHIEVTDPAAPGTSVDPTDPASPVDSANPTGSGGDGTTTTEGVTSVTTAPQSGTASSGSTPAVGGALALTGLSTDPVLGLSLILLLAGGAGIAVAGAAHRRQRRN